ncbi:DUF305 domain-containing protein [Steroidobacter sp.]|uniref:DUF305 domain-containing protein n=1 Tax=Steroidobacter sp. TaxID=1978227 RepID=UPI001A4837D0|nr:DUF305 domain-containing protein [Steroidobacter sp.]MBL8265700.1 DUF305 domain-containing protein [Steroidobacter sp.]
MSLLPRECLLSATVIVGIFVAPSLQAEEPGRGFTAQFEVSYLKSIADHHLSALRMTELAAGTDTTRDPAISPAEGTSPTPDRQPVEAKAVSEELKSLARRNNRMQREEILTALKFLRDWYGMEYSPKIDKRGQAQIALLEHAPAGADFDRLFMEVLSRHHYLALRPSTQCQVSAELEHHMLQRYCSGIVHGQINDISDMREMLCRDFSICDYQPHVGLKGRHSGEDGEAQTDTKLEQ